MMGPQEILGKHGSRHGPVKWPLPATLTSSPAVAYRNCFAEALSLKTPERIVSSYVYLAPNDMQGLVNLILRRVLMRPLAGYGIELGAGCGLLSSVVAEHPRVQGIFALEVCEKMAELVIPKISNWILAGKSSKVIPVVGSFDDIRLADDSLDFAIEIDSLHHSDDLGRTLSECARVLKPGGILICLDRCHPNSVSDAEVQTMLNRVYSREFLVANHYPPDVVLRRRDNGEHEYRVFEWERAFKWAGFRVVKTVRFAKTVSGRTALKGLLSCLPGATRLGLRIGRTEATRLAHAWLRQLWRRISPALRGEWEILAPKETTVFYAEKP
jgi:ubiquinone/menaquinone biosynthesis C-methylase UbiE